MKKAQPRTEIQQVSKRQAASVQLYQHQGPLPDPQTLAEYDHVLPGSAERILSMAERQQAHRQNLEAMAVRAETRNSSWGILCAFLLGAFSVIGGVVVAYSGKELGGSLISGTGLASLVGTFIYGTRQRRLEREAKVATVRGR